MRHRIHQRIFWLSCIAIAFFQPVFGRIVPVCIGIMVLNWLIEGRFLFYLTRFHREMDRVYIFSFASLYFLYLTGLIYTTNFGYGWFDLEIKLSLLIFPLVFATSPWPLFSQKQISCILWSFVAGCMAGSLIFLGHASVNEYSYRIPDSFYYMKLAWFFHPSYLSMYYNFAIGFLLLGLLKTFNENFVKSIFLGGLIIYLSVMILLLSSKAGVITLAVLIVLAAVYSWKRSKARLAGLMIIGCGLVLFGIGYWLAPVAFSRISAAGRAVASQQSTERVQSESNADRMAVWATAVDIIEHNYLIGVGTGDVKDALMEGYKKNKLFPAFEHKLNAHNQYLQTFVALGLGGFLLLAALIVLPAIRAFRNHQDIYFVFLLIFALNILFESMLEVQAGVVFYAFFNVFLFSKKETGTQFPEPPFESK